MLLELEPEKMARRCFSAVISSLFLAQYYEVGRGVNVKRIVAHPHKK